MFGTFPSPSVAASLQTSTHAATPTPASPTRPSTRLRGLSYLLHHHHHHHNNNNNHSPTSPSSPPLSPSLVPHPPLSRSHSTPTGGRRQTQSSARAHITPSPQRTNNHSSSSNNTSDDSSNPTSGWVPTVGGRSGLSRVAPQPQSTATDSSTSTSVPITSMTRRRAATGVEDAPPTARPLTSQVPPSTNVLTSVTSAPDPASTPAPTAAPTPAVESRDATESTAIPKRDMPTIRLIPHHEPRSSRPSLTFPIVTRTLPTASTRVRVGRYSERDSGAADALSNPLSTAPVGFKSKVVSRRHCELWCEGGQWFVKDVKSSSGTFLNHVRLSSPGMESRAYPVNDGDIVQLGIDFKGGEEQIFRCVKIRVECNRGWQKSLNQFNTSTHKRLLKSTQSGAAKDSDANSINSSECSICLCPVAPCQALFVAPCSHVWHYKCIRTLIYPSWPSFQCPNCRAYADLEADVDPPEEEEEDLEDDDELEEASKGSKNGANEASAAVTSAGNAQDDEDMSDMMNSVSVRDLSPSPQPMTESSGSGSEGELEAGRSSTATSHPVPITASTRAPINGTLPDSILARSATPTSTTQFALADIVLSDGGPTTPMNDVGPFLFDNGSARRSRLVDDIARGVVREEAEEK